MGCRTAIYWILLVQNPGKRFFEPTLSNFLCFYFVISTISITFAF